MVRSGRNYELFIDLKSARPDLPRQTVLIRPPIRITFSGSKSVAGGLNRIDLEVYNLAEDKRLAIAEDPEEDKNTSLQLSVGYGTNLEPLFRGTIYRAENARDGAEIITSIECVDGGFDYQFSETDRTVAAGADPVTAILKDMPNTERGFIRQRQPLQRPKVMSGRSARELDKIVEDDEFWFILDGRLNIIQEGQSIGGTIPLVSPATGLLETPTREQQIVTFRTQFNPSVKAGGLLELESTLAPQMNGAYQARTITYDGDLDGDSWEMEVEAHSTTRPETLG